MLIGILLISNTFSTLVSGQWTEWSHSSGKVGTFKDKVECHPLTRYLWTVVKHIQHVKEQITFSCYKVLVVGKM